MSKDQSVKVAIAIAALGVLIGGLLWANARQKAATAQTKAAEEQQNAKVQGPSAPPAPDRSANGQAATAPVKREQDRCCPDGGDAIGFAFAGVYLDDKCRKQPVVQAQLSACTPVNIPAYESEVDVVMSEPMANATVKKGSARLVLGSRVVELEPLYLLRGGKCTPMDSGIKRLPRSCNNGGVVCRTGRAATALGCSGCMTDAKGCPLFEGSMAYVEASPKR
jgi:hypothetical protein